MAPVPTDEQNLGVAFPRAGDGRSTTATGRAVFADAARAVDRDLATTIEAERDWRGRYRVHARALLEARLRAVASPDAVTAAGLSSLHDRFVFVRDGQELPLREAFEHAGPPLHTAVVNGRGDGGPRRVEVPFRGRRLSGEPLPVAHEAAEGSAGTGDPPDDGGQRPPCEARTRARPATGELLRRPRADGGRARRAPQRGAPRGGGPTRLLVHGRVRGAAARARSRPVPADRGSEWLTPRWRTADWTYVRFHWGTSDPEPCYAPQTLGARLDGLAERWGPGEDDFVSFNNDPRCCAVRDAELLARACDRRGIPRTRAPAAGDYRVWR